MAKPSHTIILEPLEDLVNACVRIEDGYNWIDVSTGADLLKGVKYKVTINIEEE